jgi:hypothetical protein
MFCTVGFGIPPVPYDEILPPVDLINVKLYTCSIHSCIIYIYIYIFKKHKKFSFAQYMKELKWIELWIWKEIGQNASDKKWQRKFVTRLFLPFPIRHIEDYSCVYFTCSCACWIGFGLLSDKVTTFLLARSRPCPTFVCTGVTSLFADFH